MLEPLRHLLEGKSITLASSSPRRKEIFRNILNLKFDVEKPDFEEDLDKSNYLRPHEYVKDTALRKTEDVLLRILKTKKVLPDIVVGADTVVFLDGEIIEKPKDFEDAMKILHKLSGRKHGVCTGVVLMTLKSKESRSNYQEPINQMYDISIFDETSWVEFDLLSKDVIQQYVETGEPMYVESPRTKLVAMEFKVWVAH